MTECGPCFIWLLIHLLSDSSFLYSCFCFSFSIYYVVFHQYIWRILLHPAGFFHIIRGIAFSTSTATNLNEERSQSECKSPGISHRLSGPSWKPAEGAVRNGRKAAPGFPVQSIEGPPRSICICVPSQFRRSPSELVEERRHHSLPIKSGLNIE